MGKGQRWPLSMAMLAQAHLLTGLASLTRGTSGARQTLGRKKRSDEPPQMWVTKGDEERDNISPPRVVCPRARAGDRPHLEARSTSRTLFTSFSSGTLGETGQE